MENEAALGIVHGRSSGKMSVGPGLIFHIHLYICRLNTSLSGQKEK